MLTFNFPVLGGLRVHMAVTRNRAQALNAVVDYCGYSVLPLKDDDPNQDCVGWVFGMPSANTFFLWINADLPATHPDAGCFGVYAVLAHELLHIAQRAAEGMHTTLDKCEEPLAYMMGVMSETIIQYLRYRRRKLITATQFRQIARAFNCEEDRKVADYDGR